MQLSKYQEKYAVTTLSGNTRSEVGEEGKSGRNVQMGSASIVDMPKVRQVHYKLETLNCLNR